MKRIFKYKFPIDDYVTLSLPVGAEILTIQEQKGELQLWALVDPTIDTHTDFWFAVRGTGHDFVDSDKWEYLTSVQQFNGELIWHIFTQRLRPV